MNGTQLLRRSASIALAVTLLAVTSCGVEFNGLFAGDGGADDDVVTGMDGATTDARLDGRADALPDGGGSPDVTIEEAGRADVAIDTASGNDGASDGRDAGGKVDTGSDGTVGVDTRSDSSGEPDVKRDNASDVSGDPVEDGTIDVTSDPRIDVTNDLALDIAVDAVDASTDISDGGPPGSCDAGACSTFANISPNVTRTVEMGPPPTMTGGTIVDGTYIVTSIVHYNNDISMYSLSETSIISGNMDAWVASTNGGVPVRYTTYFTTSAPNEMTFTFCCPAPGNLTILYTTDGTKLSHVDPANTNRVITYTRQ